MIKRLGRVKPIKFWVLLLFLVGIALLLPRFLFLVQAAGYGCPYKYCSGCWCVNGVCNVPAGCPDGCSGSFGEGSEYCCSPTPTPEPTPTLGPTPTHWWTSRPTPTPTPKKACNEACFSNGQCSTNYCYGQYWWTKKCRNKFCPEEVDCICPTPSPTPTPTPKKACNEACSNNGECSTNYCYDGRCRDRRWPDEEDCECPETKMCRYKGCTAVNGQCVWRDFGPIPWEAPCPEDDCRNDNDCKNIKLCTWNQCSCPDDFCYRFENFAIDPSKDCPVSDCTIPGSWEDPDCIGVCPDKYECNRDDPDAPFCYKDDDGPYATLDSCEIECQPSVTPTPTPSPAPGWFQTEGGGVHSNYDSNVGDSVSSQIPATADEPFFSIEFEGNTPGVVSGSNTDMSFGSGSVSTKGWRIDSYSGQLYTGVSLPRYDYDYFHNTLGLGAEAGACPSGPDSGIFKCDSGLSIDSDWNLSDDHNMVVFVEGGNLNINAKINVPKGAFLAFIVKDNINIDGSIGGDINESDGIGEDEVFIDGVFITDGRISTGDSNKRLVASGIFVAYGGFDFSGRDLEDDNEITPAELFLYRPDFVINAPDELKKSAMTWQEVAP